VRLELEDSEDSTATIQGVADAKKIAKAEDLFSFLNANYSFSNFIAAAGIADPTKATVIIRDKTSGLRQICTEEKKVSDFLLSEILEEAMQDPNFTLPDFTHCATPIDVMKEVAKFVNMDYKFVPISSGLLAKGANAIWEWVSGTDNNKAYLLCVQNALRCAVNFAKLAKYNWVDGVEFRSLCVQWCAALGLE
jgi:hypothetical protein